MIHAHAGLRLVILLFLTIAIITSLIGWMNKKPYSKMDNIIAILLISFTHIQAIIGIVIFAMSDMVKGGLDNMGATMSDSYSRFWVIEHPISMFLVVIFITLGRVKSKKAATDLLKHKKGAIFYLLAFIFVLWAGVIKPLAMGRGWF